MYCKCAKGNNYQVIGLCDPTTISPVAEASWVQITVPEILPLPDCYPDIEELERIYINVVIESSRIVETPTSGNEENYECDKVTGYKLIVDGSLCQTIIYTADTCEQSLHSINFKYPFCTGIVLNRDQLDLVHPLETKFCIETCIENVYAKVLNEKTIFKSVTLFIEAKKAEVKCCPDDDDAGIV